MNITTFPYNKTAKIKYAVKNIPCYKVIHYSGNSAWFHFLYEYNKVYETPLKFSYEDIKLSNDTLCDMKTRLRFLNMDIKYISDKSRYNHNINELSMGFHSYANYYDAINDYLYHSLWEYVVAEFVIPKGSWYYVGYADGVANYVSDHIKMISIQKVVNKLNKFA